MIIHNRYTVYKMTAIQYEMYSKYMKCIVSKYSKEPHYNLFYCLSDIPKWSKLFEGVSCH